MTAVVLALSLMSAGAMADDALSAAYDSCLERAQLPPRRPVLWAVGPNTRVEKNSYGAITTGLWELSCDGVATYDERVIARFPQPPAVGRVITDKVPKAALRCFLEVCAFPQGVCPGRSGDDPIVEGCGGEPLTANMLAAGPGDPPDIDPPDIEAPVVAMDLADPLEIPPRPSAPCDTPSALRTESRAHLELGNQSELAGDSEAAEAEYRAALSLAPCSGLAWVSMGLLSERLGRPDRAVRALEVGLELSPGHYGAATALGLAYEQLGHPAMAATAYRAALAARPDHRPALEGLERVEPPADSSSTPR